MTSGRSGGVSRNFTDVCSPSIFFLEAPPCKFVSGKRLHKAMAMVNITIFYGKTRKKKSMAVFNGYVKSSDGILIEFFGVSYQTMSQISSQESHFPTRLYG